MSNRVYVGNLSWGTSWQDLKDHMREVGDVQYAKVLQDRDGRSKGCGIVEFETPEGAAEAIEKLTDTELKGRKIFVREDREDGNKRGGGGGGGGGDRGGDNRGERNSRPPPKHDEKGDYDRGEANKRYEGAVEGASLFIGNLSWETGWQDLKDHFNEIGAVERADVAEGRDGRKKGFGFVRYGNAEDAKKAIDELNGVEFMGREIEVRLDNKA